MPSFSTGYLLDTPTVRRMHPDDRRIAAAEEERSLFFDFHTYDQGRSRELVCQFKDAREARLAHAHLGWLHLTRKQFFDIGLPPGHALYSALCALVGRTKARRSGESA